MGTLRTYIDPVSTNQIINNLNVIIDEVKLEKTLTDMTNRIKKIEATRGCSEITEHLEQEIKILQIQINYIRDQAAFSEVMP